MANEDRHSPTDYRRLDGLASSLCRRTRALLLAAAATALAMPGTALAEPPAPEPPPLDAARMAGLRATVFGPDASLRADLSGDVPVRELNLAIEGAQPVPKLFWFNRKLRVWISEQKGPAPLVIVIPGAGGGGDANKLQTLRKALYGAGYHVLTVPSPTFPRFIVAASSTGVAGDLRQDASDLRRAIRQVLAQLQPGVRITGLHVVGYSLGGAHAALVKALDAGPEPLGIERAVMINPPVSLYASISRLDRLFAATIGTDSDAIEAFYRRLYADLDLLYQNSDALMLDEEFLLRAASRLLQTNEEYGAAIALSFRIALINMFFAGDYYARTGVVVDPGDPPDPGDPLDPTFRTLRTKTFKEYFDRVFAPYYLARRPDWDSADLLAANTLKIVAEELAENPDYFAQATVDDLIHDAGELDWLRRTLGPRIVVYDHGGHLGNLGERAQIQDMLAMLAGRAPHAGVRP